MEVKPVLRYPGGKSRAVKEIAGRFPSSFKEYREPMVGGGSVFIYTKNNNLAGRYWINDKFTDLIYFWQILQSKPQCENLIATLKLGKMFNSTEDWKDRFHDMRRHPPKDQFGQAVNFFFCNRVTFSGTTQAGGFSKQACESRFTMSSIDRLKPFPEFLKDVEITNLDFEPVITQPGEGVFIFLDPPYLTAKKLYGKNGELHSFNHARLASLLKNTNHKFLMTYDDCEEVRKLYSWAIIEEWQLQYGMSKKKGSELFVRNY